MCPAAERFVSVLLVAPGAAPIGFLITFSSSGSMGAQVLGRWWAELHGSRSVAITPLAASLFFKSPSLALFSVSMMAAFYAILCGGEVGDLVYFPRTEPL